MLFSAIFVVLQVMATSVVEKWCGGTGRHRTGDPLLARQVLYQLSYSPTVMSERDVGGPAVADTTPPVALASRRVPGGAQRSEPGAYTHAPPRQEPLRCWHKKSEEPRGPDHSSPEDTHLTKTPAPIEISGGQLIADIFRGRLADLDHEEFWILTLTRDHEIIGEHQIHVGHRAGVSAKTRRILRRVLLDDAAAFVVIHNHPSGNPRPSATDLSSTRALAAAAETVGLRLLDHVIVAAEKHHSFDHHGQLATESSP